MPIVLQKLNLESSPDRYNLHTFCRTCVFFSQVAQIFLIGMKNILATQKIRMAIQKISAQMQLICVLRFAVSITLVAH